MAERTLVIAAGGTGGHLFPAAAFASQMIARGWRVVLMTDHRGRRYANDFPADEVIETPAATIQGLNPARAVSAVGAIFAGIRAAKQRLAALDAALVAGFGGYPSLPALWAARAQRRPILIHEQNAVLGRVNRFFAPHAAVIACGFERLDRLDPAAAGRKRVTGNPVRPAVLAARGTPYPQLPAGGPIHLLITGGSQGARILGEVVPSAIALLPEAVRARLRVVQQVREEQVQVVKAEYEGIGVAAEVAPFFSDMGARLGWAHLVIARAGASTVTELQAVGRPAILIPLGVAADDHQTANAEGLSEVGAADVLPERAATAEALCEVLERRLLDPHALAVRAAAARAAGTPEAAADLADAAESIAAAARARV